MFCSVNQGVMFGNSGSRFIGRSLWIAMAVQGKGFLGLYTPYFWLWEACRRGPPNG